MKKIIHTDKAPAPIGPYSQGVQFGKIPYNSEQNANNPATGELEIEDITTETTLVMENLKEILKAAGMNFEHVLKASIFVSDMHNFEAINKVYATYFNPETAPARETVEVANLPKFVNVEISVIASL